MQQLDNYFRCASFVEMRTGQLKHLRNFIRRQGVSLDQVFPQFAKLHDQLEQTQKKISIQRRALSVSSSTNLRNSRLTPFDKLMAMHPRVKQLRELHNHADKRQRYNSV